ncbi:hypothetical protein [Embleya scabrispora]|uniref:hypothetical protein n=1 Tax=Embleya scabrispora TaxID=159449 RepID=UPI00117C7E9B|nr:hypothetical protein [Embleya scabrispora]
MGLADLAVRVRDSDLPPVASGHLWCTGIAAAMASLAVVVADVYAYFVYRDWRTDLASRVHTWVEPEALSTGARMVPRGNGTTDTAAAAVFVTSVTMIALVVWWTVLVSRNRAAWYGPSRGFGVLCRSGHRRTGSAGRAGIGPTPVLVSAVGILVFTTLTRLLGLVGKDWSGPLDGQIRSEMGFLHSRMVLALAHATGALLMAFVVTTTTRRHLRLPNHRPDSGPEPVPHPVPGPVPGPDAPTDRGR